MKEGYATMCCCCVCACEDKETKGEKCCLIFPIKCGVQFIALSVLLIAVCQFLEVFYQLLNDKVDWWYVLVGVILCIPLIIALAFAIVFFSDENDTERVLLSTACILTIISLTLSAAWNASYFWFFYKSDEVVTGNDGIGFTHATRKQEIVFSVYIAAVADCFFAYYLCVLSNYINLYREARIAEKMKELQEAADEESKPLKEEPAATDNAGSPPPEEPAAAAAPAEEPAKNDEPAPAEGEGAAEAAPEGEAAAAPEGEGAAEGGAAEGQ